MRENFLTPTTSDQPETEMEITPLLLWQEAIGKIFKLVTKSYGARTVTYTHVKAVKESIASGDFEIEVCCIEITARVLNSKRAHSSMCKEGTIEQTHDSIITPQSFGDECAADEYERIAGSILTHVTTKLDLVAQSADDEKTEIEVPIDLPHLKLTDMEASLVQNSPFLVKGVYLLSANSRKAALESINQELLRAARNSRLTDACDPVYVSQKSDAVTSLRKKLAGMPAETNGHHNGSGKPLIQPATAPRPESALAPKQNSNETVEDGVKPVPSISRRLGLTPIEKRNLIALALRGKPSSANLMWERQNPSTEGAVYRIGKECGLLEFVRWAHVTGRAVAEGEVAGKSPRVFFNGPDASYTGPDRTGIYPLLKF